MIESFEHAIELNLDVAGFYNNLGFSQGNLGLHKDAIKSYKRAIKVDPDNDRYYYNLGVAQDNLGLYKEARKSYKRAKEINLAIRLVHKGKTAKEISESIEKKLLS